MIGSFGRFESVGHQQGRKRPSNHFPSQQSAAWSPTPRSRPCSPKQAIRSPACPSINQGYVCRPAHRWMYKNSTLSITTPFVRISFVVEPTGGAMFFKPGTGAQEAPSLPDGSPQFETRAQSVRATTEYTWIRSQHRDIERYQRWAERVVTGAQRWFEG